MTSGLAGAMLRAVRGRALKVVVSAATVAMLARQLDTAELSHALAEARWAPVGGAIVTYLASQAVTAWRWRLIAWAAGFADGFGRMLAWYYIGMFFNLFGPSTLGGDLVRTLYLGSGAGRVAAAFQTVVFDRMSGLAMLVVLALLALGRFGTFGLPALAVWVTVAVGAALVLVWWLAPALAQRFSPPGEENASVPADRELRRLWRDGGLLASTSAVSLGFHVVQVGAAMLIGHAVGLAVPWPFYFVFHPLVTIFSALPVSLAGIGIREAGYVWFLSSLGTAPSEQAAAFALLWLAVLTFSSIVGGLVFLASGAAVPNGTKAGAPLARVAARR